MFPTLFDTIDFLKQCDADIICLQEVNESAKAGFQVSSLKEELEDELSFWSKCCKLRIKLWTSYIFKVYNYRVKIMYI